MTTSIEIVTLSSVITGCGGNVTTCSRMSTNGAQVIEERQQHVQARRQRAAVAAEPLDDADERLRHDAHRRSSTTITSTTTIPTTISPVSLVLLWDCDGGAPASRGTTRTVTPATDSMRTTAPGAIGGSSSLGVRAVQYSEPTRT